MERIERHASFGGWQDVYQHESSSLGCTMKFGVYLPPQASSGPVPVLYWLSGLTCTEQNFITKSAVQQLAAEHGIAIVAPDTSPRGESVADDPAYDLGQGAGFYVNATEAPWSDHYRMYDYVVSELPALVEKNFPVSRARSISGHSMGGHGALVIALRNPVAIAAYPPSLRSWHPPRLLGARRRFRPTWGDQEQWRQYDAVELIADAKERLPLLVDQGLSDDFLQNQLRPELLQDACAKVNHPLSLNLRDGYDHSYYFISSFIADHLKHHASALNT